MRKPRPKVLKCAFAESLNVKVEHKYISLSPSGFECHLSSKDVKTLIKTLNRMDVYLSYKGKK